MFRNHLVDSLLVWGLPVGMAGLGLGLFALRYVRLRRRPKGDPEALLLSAVSGSLSERGELAAKLGTLSTVQERLVDALPFGLLWVDQRSRLAALNAPGRALLGVRPGVVGMEAAFVLEPFPWLLEALSQEPGEPWRCDGGGRRWQLRRISAPEGVGALVQFEDITEREIEERRLVLRERFAELGEMTAGVAHQLKNGLAVLKGQGQLLARAGHQDLAADLLTEVDGLLLLTQRFLQWAKPLQPELVELDLAAAATQAMEEVRRRPLAQGRRLEVLGAGRAIGDAMLLHQSLVNLLENACQATPAGGAVRLEVGEGQLDLTDEGPGLSEETLTRMLRPFESGRPEGTGLGLPLALKWLNAQGADLAFEVRPEGGTRVRIRW
jgi:signal transduction histidine kinase